MVGGVKTPTVPGNTTADNSDLTACKDDSSCGDTCNRRNDSRENPVESFNQKTFIKPMTSY